jgi:hypothetical protein
MRSEVRTENTTHIKNNISLTIQLVVNTHPREVPPFRCDFTTVLVKPHLTSTEFSYADLLTLESMATYVPHSHVSYTCVALQTS